MFRKICVALDGSPLAECALKPASSIARAFQSEMKLVMVEELPETLERTQWDLTQDEILQQAFQRSQDYLRSLAHSLRSQGCSVVYELLPLGSPTTRILADMEKERPDLLVISSHGRTGLPRLIMGSVAESLARESPCPVMIVGHKDYPPEGKPS